MNILGIETSCDETSASVVSNGKKILSNIVSSQEKIHKIFFGIVPELASRAHIENINYVIESSLKKAGIKLTGLRKNIDAIAYTKGPGLAGSLLVGEITAKTLSYVHSVPLVPVNHLEGHLYSCLLSCNNLKPPFLGLVVSGGHTELIIVKDFGKYTYLGGTRDDAAGEAFDKVAKLLKLGYPGGPLVEKFAKRGNENSVKLPRPFMWGTWEFSFSGLKTAVVNYVNTHKVLTKNIIYDLCASFQASVVDTLIEKTISAAKKYKLNSIVLGGGVTANSVLRKRFLDRGIKEKIKVYLPELSLSTDNAAMIACAGYYKLKNRKKKETLKSEPNLELKNW